MATILIVDDRPANRDFLVTLLGYSGHRLLQASDGAEALAIAMVERPNLVIADILMPTMDGFELVRQIRATLSIADTPVIFCTAHYHEREAHVLAQLCGVSQVLTKPAEPEAVLSAVATALGASTSSQPARPVDEFDREHVRLLTDKLSEKANDLKTTVERLSAMVDLNLQLASETDLRKLIQSFGHATREIVGARYSITGILSADGKRFQFLFTSGINAEAAVRLGSPDPHSEPLRSILKDSPSVRLHNSGGDPVALGLSASHPAVHAWLGASIASPNRIYGFISLIDKIGVNEFSPEDERLARILAAQAGRIYQNGSLYSEVLRHAADLEREISARIQTEKELANRVRQGILIAEVDAALTQSETQTEMLERCARALSSHFEYAPVQIWTVNPAEQVLELKTGTGLSERADDAQIEATQGRLALGVSVIGEIASQRSPYFTNDVQNDQILAGSEWANREGMVSFAGYPLLVKGDLTGVLAVMAAHPIPSEATSLIQTISDKIALGIERYRAHEELRERDEHIRLLLDSTAEAIYGIDQEGRCTFANLACARLLGYPDTSYLIGKDMHALVHHSRADGTPYPAEECKIFQAFRESREVHVEDEVFWRADGSCFPAEYWSHPVHRQDRVAGSVINFIDTTERRELEQQYRRAQQRLSHVVASSPTVLLTLTMSSQRVKGISWISDNLVDVFGYPPDVALGSEWWESNIHGDDLERVRSQTSAALIELGHTSQEYRFRHADGMYRWVRSDFRLIRDEARSPLEAVGAWSDISTRKHAEEEQSRLREQLEQARRLESLGQLSGGIAHDFNNLLGVVIGSAELLQGDLPRNSELRRYTGDILNAAQRAAELTQQLLAFSRQQVFEPTILKLNALVQDFAKMLRRVIPENIEIRTLLKTTGSIRGHAGQIERVIMNLAVNARDAMPRGGQLTIETADVELDEQYALQHAEVTPGPHVMLAVTDTGSGMTREVQAHMFEPFFTTKERGKGTGLGLGTVHGIVKQGGGSIFLYSEPGRGTTVKIYFPRVNNGIETNRVRFSANEMPRGRETILLAEDESTLRSIVGDMLTGLGYTVLTAETGEEALVIAGAYKPPIHLLVTDLIMPGIGGRELADRLTDTRPGMRVLYVSGYTDDTVITQAVFSSQVAFLQKPFALMDLAQKLRAVLATDPPDVGPEQGGENEARRSTNDHDSGS